MIINLRDHNVIIYVSNQSSNISSNNNQEGKKKSSWDYKLGETLLHLKKATYINNTCNIYWTDIYIS